MSYHPDVQEVLNRRRRNKRALKHKMKIERSLTERQRATNAAAIRRMAGDL